MEYNYKQRLVIENFKWVNSVVIFGMILAGVSVIAKLTGLTTIDVYTNIKLSSDESWKVLGILTIAHWYTSYLLKSSIDSLLSSEKEDKCLEVFQEITVSGGILIRGLSPRTKIFDEVKSIRYYRMEWNDPSTWIAYASVPLIIASIIPFNVSIPLFFTKYLFISITIVSINWIIGSSWIIKISELSNPLKSQSLNKEGSRLAISSSPIPSSFLPFIFYGVGILQIVAERVPVIGGLIIVIINVFIEIIFCFMNIIFAIYLKISFKLSYISSKLLKKRLSILSILFAFLILLILT